MSARKNSTKKRKPADKSKCKAKSKRHLESSWSLTPDGQDSDEEDSEHYRQRVCDKSVIWPVTDLGLFFFWPSSQTRIDDQHYTDDYDDDENQSSSRNRRSGDADTSFQSQSESDEEEEESNDVDDSSSPSNYQSQSETDEEEEKSDKWLEMHQLLSFPHFQKLFFFFDAHSTSVFFFFRLRFVCL